MTMQRDSFRTSNHAPISPALADLIERRTRLCRLHPDYALESIEEAETFVAERGLLTLTPDCSLPSLFGACHEEPYQPGGHGFAGWPKTRWRWASLLSERPGVHAVKLHRGKMLYLSPETAAGVDPLCRQELVGAVRGAYGPLAAELVEYLEVAGPSLIDDVKHELNLDAPALRRIRERLERVGAVVSRAVVVPARGGESERETSELARWDQCFPENPSPVTDGLAELVAAGVRSAVVAPQDEVSSWFSWPITANMCTRLIDDARLWQPEDGWIAEASSREMN
jgi:hypothetical protein